MDLRATAREIFLETLCSLDLRTALGQRLSLQRSVLHITETTYDLARFPHILLIAMGKAAVPMTEALLQTIRPALTPRHRLEGIVVGTASPSEAASARHPHIRYRFGSHPFPDHTSAQAATAILNLLATATPQTLVFFLLSGGASAMVELPVHPGLTLDDLIAFHRVLVHSGLSIAEMNTLRKHLSAVKGGRLALAAAPATRCTLLVSDVLPSQPDVIASGPSLPDPTTLAHCRHLLDTQLAHHPVPKTIRTLFRDNLLPETPKPHDPLFAHDTAHTLLSSDDLATAAQRAARLRGFHTVIDQTPDEWPFDRAAAFLLERLRDLTHAHPHTPVCLVSTGELSVPITVPNPGTGGRNQHFVLHCALRLANERGSTAVLSAGSDGADGNSPAAGSVADNTTVSRAGALGLDPTAPLARFDTYPLFHALGDALLTGPTGNNLRDLRLLLATADKPSHSA